MVSALYVANTLSTVEWMCIPKSLLPRDPVMSSSLPSSDHLSNQK
ncbi:hypothetical protein ISN45_At02g018660 [Arabidopsis thaliana x Arabidopsis arenosa]|uniref:Uncharacterized protein n=3 Tax=Arabidopsis TaxID=3701 RepID=B3H6V4_ARATH|nr:uncharacterized protein AT2G24683 [Arabidopsis thaliana]AEC07615.1 hypothetical protein AT2G24683 [Arabidopsis thaliana]KAG7637320.1 hypothetical protein ISN45_At02g018660 [Arabidopsis thaliana x Arabidopsis arenosa]KAG7641935.1 hypothetical protein ISN44_As02g019060 [Arabidopsis suecica]|eukprot:NP_001118379.1 hypothetical protein AT2G24683 [Arabidopsis thaliana]